MLLKAQTDTHPPAYWPQSDKWQENYSSNIDNILKYKNS